MNRVVRSCIAAHWCGTRGGSQTFAIPQKFIGGVGRTKETEKIAKGRPAKERLPKLHWPDSEAAAPAAAAAAASAAVPPPAAVGCFYGGRGKKPFSNSVFLFFNSFPHLMQAAFFSHQAAFLYERKHVCCVAGPCEAALSHKIKVAHIFEGVFD